MTDFEISDPESEQKSEADGRLNRQLNTRAFKHSVYRLIKRTIDIVLSILSLILFSPLFLIIYALIKLEDLKKPKESRGAVFFSHSRLGLHGKPITVHKFRSMVCNAQDLITKFSPEQKKEFEENFKLKDDPRITNIGKLLRKTSLDELPQIWDIFIGNLSIVGPRPIVFQELEKYGDNKDRFLSVKPGLTGYWQVSGRSSVSYDERVELELYYVDHQSFCLDFLIIFKTVIAVLSGKGAR
ncbi:MAG: sugar transferase [Eubacterium sp.]|jgi:lipopolysaccharide/colanic/teichoic acid biosynthesis glycosyltransferase|nr:sugar transferase [Eubacterium sp.]